MNYVCIIDQMRNQDNYTMKTTRGKYPPHGGQDRSTHCTVNTQLIFLLIPISVLFNCLFGSGKVGVMGG